LATGYIFKVGGKFVIAAPKFILSTNSAKTSSPKLALSYNQNVSRLAEECPP